MVQFSNLSMFLSSLATRIKKVQARDLRLSNSSFYRDGGVLNSLELFNKLERYRVKEYAFYPYYSPTPPLFYS